MTQPSEAIIRLHEYLACQFLEDGALIGPDPGVRFNYRIGRFLKNYIPIGWSAESLFYVQGQSYWILANWALFALTGDEKYRQLALSCSTRLVSAQRPDGAWDYPHPEWKGRVATAEGTWGAIGLLESFARTGNRIWLESALRWKGFLDTNVGYAEQGDSLAVHYFADQDGDRIPNNSAFTLRFLAMLARATGDASHRAQCEGMLRFLASVQLPDGELPYAVSGSENVVTRLHFQCFQYSAYQCLDLISYQCIVGETPDCARLIEGLCRFVLGGIRRDGSVAYDCSRGHRTVVYHAAAVGDALVSASPTESGEWASEGERVLSWVRGEQRSSGGFPHSHSDYGVLRDQRGYPRYLAMILHHLLHASPPDSKGAHIHV